MYSSKAIRYLMFGLLYFTQGIILSYFTSLNALYFLSNGLTMTDAGIFAAIALVPFVIKIFLGMLSDRVNLFGMGHRKPYILIGLTVQIICLLLVPKINLSTQYWWFVLIAFMLQMGMALYDTCTDGLALDSTPEAEQGTLQGVMVGGRAFGVVVTASLLGLLADVAGWPWVFYTLAILTLFAFPLVLGVRETRRPAGQSFNWKAFAAFKSWPIAALAAAGLLMFFIINGANQIVNPFMQKTFDISLSQAGLYTTVWGVGVVLGGVSGGLLLSKLGRKNAVLSTLAFTLVAIAALSLIPSKLAAWPIIFLFGLAFGAYQAQYYALSMAFTEKSIAASMYAILMAMSNIGIAAGLSVSGILADALPFRTVFLILAGMNLLILPFLPTIWRARQTE
jgi:PAT family beta-lactamase induction signal transducer AmpG